jgi:hypothetical protein
MRRNILKVTSSPVVDHVDSCAADFFARVRTSLKEMLVLNGHYDESCGDSCITFAGVEGCTNFETAVDRLLKIEIAQAKSTVPSRKDFGNLMCFRDNEAKKTFWPYGNYIDTQFKVYANVRGPQHPNFNQKKKVATEILAIAIPEVEVWINEQKSRRPSLLLCP